MLCHWDKVATNHSWRFIVQSAQANHFPSMGMCTHYLWFDWLVDSFISAGIASLKISVPPLEPSHFHCVKWSLFWTNTSSGLGTLLFSLEFHLERCNSINYSCLVYSWSCQHLCVSQVVHSYSVLSTVFAFTNYHAKYTTLTTIQLSLRLPGNLRQRKRLIWLQNRRKFKIELSR